MKKRILSLLLCLIMVMSILPISAFAEGECTHPYTNVKSSVVYSDGAFKIKAELICSDCGAVIDSCLLSGEHIVIQGMGPIEPEKYSPCMEDISVQFSSVNLEAAPDWAKAVRLPARQEIPADPNAHTMSETPAEYDGNIPDDPSIVKITYKCTGCGEPMFSYLTPSRKDLIGLNIPLKFVCGEYSHVAQIPFDAVFSSMAKVPYKLERTAECDEYTSKLNIRYPDLKFIFEHIPPEELPFPADSTYSVSTSSVTIPLRYKGSWDEAAQKWNGQWSIDSAEPAEVMLDRAMRVDFKADFIGDIPELRPDIISFMLDYEGQPLIVRTYKSNDFKFEASIKPDMDLSSAKPDMTSIPEYINTDNTYDPEARKFESELVLPDNAKLQVHVLKPLTTSYPISLDITDDVVSWDGERQLSIQDRTIGSMNTHIALDLNLEDSASATDAGDRLPITRYKKDGSLTEHNISFKIVNTDNQAEETELFASSLEPMNEDRIAKLFLVENVIKDVQVICDTAEGLPADFKIKLGLKAADGTVLSEPAEAVYNSGQKMMQKEFSFPCCPVGETYAPYEFNNESIIIEDMDRHYVLSEIFYDGFTFYVKVQKYVSPTAKMYGQLNFMDSDNVKGIRPQNPELQLMRGLKKDLSDAAPVGEPVAVSDSGFCSFGLQPKTDEIQNPYVYSLQIPGLDSRYVLTQSASPSGNDIKLSVRATLPLMDIRVDKTWETEGPVPQNVVVALYDGDEKVAEAELLSYTGSNDKKQYCEFNNLFILRDENGEIRYTVKEQTPDGYYIKSRSELIPDPAYETYYIMELVNADIPLIDIKVNKVWKNTAEPMDYVEIKLTADGKELSEDWIQVRKEVNSGDNTPYWSYTFEDMPALTREGKEIEYSVIEKENRNFKTEVSEMNQNNEITITNTRIDRGVRTGDESNIGLWIGIAAAALAAIAVLAVVVIKKSKKNESDRDQDI